MEVALLSRYARTRLNDQRFDPAGFARLYSTLATQRATKILGIFARLDRRDGKPQYLRHIPRLLGYLQRSLAHPDLAPLKTWYAANLPPKGAKRRPGRLIQGWAMLRANLPMRGSAGEDDTQPRLRFGSRPRHADAAVNGHIPKPLVEVGRKSLIDYSLDRLAVAGVETAVVNVHHLADRCGATLLHAKGRKCHLR